MTPDELARVRRSYVADLGAGRDMEPLPGPPAGQRVVAPRLDRGGRDRRPELARRADLVPSPQDEPAGHRVLGEVRMGPLVDVVRQAVAPALEELGRGPRVVDLVEVHLVRLGEPERAQPHRRDDEDDEQPQVEPVEPAAALRVQRPATGPGGSGESRAARGTSRRRRPRSTVGARARPASSRSPGPTTGPATGGDAAAATRHRRAAIPPADPAARPTLGSGAGRSALSGGGAAAARFAARRSWARGRSWASSPHERPARCTIAMAGHAEFASGSPARSRASRRRRGCPGRAS